MASKVPKFGAWDSEGGENFTVYFDNARKTKTNGPRINPNDPEENPDLFQPNRRSAQAQAHAHTQTTQTAQTRADNQRKQTNVPHFGAWDNEEAVGYTVRFENARKTKNGGPTVANNEPQMNRDMAQVRAQVQAQGQGQVQVQGRPVKTRPDTKEARPKVPQFGDWESEGGGGSYTMAFDNLKKNGPNSNAPQSNRDVGPTPQEGGAKVPQFGAWEGGEAVQYTAYFDNAKKSKNLRPGMNPNEPQMNRDVDRGSGPPVAVAMPEPRDDVSRNPRANLQPRNGGSRENQAGSIPQFGGWNSDPSQGDGYTTAFTRAKDERLTPIHNNVPPSNQQQPHHINQKKQPSCCVCSIM